VNPARRFGDSGGGGLFANSKSRSTPILSVGLIAVVRNKFYIQRIERMLIWLLYIFFFFVLVVYIYDSFFVLERILIRDSLLLGNFSGSTAFYCLFI
jgi:hypothetical protein